MKRKAKWSLVRKKFTEQELIEEEMDRKTTGLGLSLDGSRDDTDNIIDSRISMKRIGSEGRVGSKGQQVPGRKSESKTTVRASTKVNTIHEKGGDSKGHLNVVATARVLRGVPTRLQVSLDRRFKLETFDDSDTRRGSQGYIFKAGDQVTEWSGSLLIVHKGEVEMVVEEPDGGETVIGRIRSGCVLGGLFAFGFVNCQLMSARWARRKSDDELAGNSEDEDNKHRVGSKKAAFADDEEENPPNSLYVVSIEDLKEMEMQCKDDINVLRRRVLRHEQLFLVPATERVATRSFFRRYSAAMIKHMSTIIDLRICKPGELIFRVGSKAESMAMLICGECDVFRKGQPAITLSRPGTCFGESALLEEKAKRSSTVRCGMRHESIIALLRKDDFEKVLDEYPGDRPRVGEQIRHKMVRQCLAEVFPSCSAEFLDYISYSGEAKSLKWGKFACRQGEEQTEYLHICREGQAILQCDREIADTLHKGDGIGFETVLGIKNEAATEYSILGGTAGCMLIRLSRSSLEDALLYFPGELGRLFSVVGLKAMPENHPWADKEQACVEIVQTLLCKALATNSVERQLVRCLLPHFTTEVYDAGATVVTEGDRSVYLMLVMCGSLQLVKQGFGDEVNMSAPCVLDADVLLGIRRQRRHTIVATSPTVIFRLPALSVMQANHLNPAHVQNLSELIANAAKLHGALRSGIQGRLRNMKTFRRFSSTLLEAITEEMELHCYMPGDVIFEEGDFNELMYIVLKGKCEGVTHGKPVLIEEGNTFG
jgi:CRP-like cAMP-binding protein